MGSEPESYSDQEVALILRRAAEMQSGRGMSLDELEAVASEAGIDAALVRRAATELRLPAADRPEPAEGSIFGPLALCERRTLPGSYDVSQATAEIRRQLGVTGKAEVTGGDLVWSARGALGARKLQVSITTRRNRTEVRVDERTTPLAAALYASIMPSSFVIGVGWIIPVSIAVWQAPWLIAVLLPLWIVGWFAISRFLYQQGLRARQAQLSALATALAEDLADRPRPAPGSASGSDPGQAH